MINKQKLWFLTLFCIILVLSAYYVAIPASSFSNLLPEKETESSTVNTTIEDSLMVLRVTDEEETLNEINELEKSLLDTTVSAEDKNNAYEKLQILNTNKGKENALESLILKEYNIKSFIKIKDDNISVTISSKDNSYEKANKIIRTIQNEFKEKKYITVKYQ